MGRWGEKKKELQGEIMSFVFDANQLYSRVFLDQKMVPRKEKVEESALCQDVSLALRKLSKRRFASETHNITSSPWRHSFTRGEEKQYLNTFGVASFCFSHASAFELQVRAGFVGGAHACVFVWLCVGVLV